PALRWAPAVDCYRGRRCRGSRHLASSRRVRGTHGPRTTGRSGRLAPAKRRRPGAARPSSGSRVAEGCSLPSLGRSAGGSRGRRSAEHSGDTRVVRAVAGGGGENSGGGHTGTENGCYVNQGLYRVYALWRSTYLEVRGWSWRRCRPELVRPYISPIAD